VVPTTQARSTPVIGVRARAAHYFFDRRPPEGTP
jgi:hypothetical protein